MRSHRAVRLGYAGSEPGSALRCQSTGTAYAQPRSGPWRRLAPRRVGAFLLYPAIGRADHDVCLTLLPSSGGGQRQLSCDLSPTSSTQTDALESPAPARDGRLAFVQGTSPIGAVGPDSQAIELGTVNDPLTRRSLQRVPYLSPNGRRHAGVSQIHWLGPNRLVWVGEAVEAVAPCLGCQMDTLRTGLDVAWLNLDGTPTVHVVPGTDYASGVSPGATEDDVYYTLRGDTRVYHQVLGTGEVSVVYDFAAAGIARDVHVVNGRMAAVVGGRVAIGIHPDLGPIQWDSGGVLHVVSLQDGSDVTLAAPGLFRRPRLSPSGSQLVAEVYPLDDSGATVSRGGDLYLFGQP
jgi:hypothetical protein